MRSANRQREVTELDRIDLTIRRAEARDYDALCALGEEIDELHRSALPEIFRRPSGAARSREYIDGLLADPSVALFVAETPQGLAGSVHAVLRDAPEIPVVRPRRTALVDSLIVRRDLHGQGVGKRLMARVEEWAEVRGAKAVELIVFEFNQEAIAFYAALGYRNLSRRMIREFLRKTE